MKSARLFPVVLALVIGCGDDETQPPVTTDPVLPAALAITVPAELAVGAPLHVEWTLDGPHDSGRVVLRLRGPGTSPMTKSGAGFFDSGVTPASGAILFIAADGSLSPTEVSASDPAASGSLDVTLPSALTGMWSVDGFVAANVAGSSQPVAFAHASTWVASGPAMRLALSNTWATPEDVVHATISLRGTETEPLRLSAWLTLPDDTVLTLPNRQIAYQPVMEGNIEAGSVTLLGAQLGQLYGEGRFAVSLKLETLDGIERASAGALIRVCSATGLLMGHVADVAGAGSIRAYGSTGALFDGDVDAAGNFSIAVNAGTYVLSATGDAWGAAALPVEVGCGQTRAVDLIGHAIADEAARGSKVRSKPRLWAAMQPQSRPPMRIAVHPNLLLIPVDERSSFRDAGRVIDGPDFKAALNEEAPEIQFIDNVDRDNITQAAANTMLLGEDTGDAIAQMSEPYRLDGIMDYQPSKTGNRYNLEARLLLLPASDAVAWRADRVTVEGGLDEVAGDRGEFELARRMTAGLVAELRGRREHPAIPTIDVTSAEVAVPGENIAVYVRVSETEPAEVVPGVSVTIDMVGGDGRAMGAAQTATTDEYGRISTLFVTPSAGPMQSTIGFRVSLARKHGPPVIVMYTGVQVRGEHSRMSSPKGLLKVGETAPATFDGQGLQQSSEVGLTSSNGTTDTTVLRLDSQLRASFQFTAAAIPGPAKAVARLGLLLNKRAVDDPRIELAPISFYIVEPYMVTAEADPGPATLNGQFISIRGKVTHDDQGIPNARLSITVTGGGEVALVGSTDAEGVYLALYQAPSMGTGDAVITVSALLYGEVVEKSITVHYTPPCTSCPLVVSPNPGPMQWVSVRKGGTVVVTTNKLVSWSTSGGSMASGVWVAPDEGGVYHLTATTSLVPLEVISINVVVDCTTTEVSGMLSGTMEPIFGAPVTPDLCGLTTSFKISPLSIDGYELEFQYGCPPTGSGSYVNFSERDNSCSYLYRYSDFVACTGPLFEAIVTPDVTHDGNSHARVVVRQGHVDFSLPLASPCVRDFEGVGIFNH